MDDLRQHFRLKKPCKNCPFRREGAVELRPGRLEGIIGDLLADDMSTFHCHKTVDYSKSEQWDEDGRYTPTGGEAMCAGAAALLWRRGRPSVAMRLGMLTGTLNVADLEEIQAEIIA